MVTLKREGWAVWVTGLPGSGKSTTANLLREALSKRGIQSQILSSDALRKSLTPKPTYTLQERDIVYRAITFITKILTDNGLNVIIDATGNMRRYRDVCRAQVNRFIEVYLKCPLEVCMEREESRKETFQAPRGIYLKARAGESRNVPGLGAPYEPPENPEVIADSQNQSPEEIVQLIVARLLGGSAGSPQP
ncbi:adenylyl-sulfate kinase [Candidatus Bathyarchaeota archaeon]|nr:adenylyl-sulfate kinase [Candidatus Bathyarchaeota archaeon]